MHPNDSMAHLIGMSKGVRKASTASTKVSKIDMDINGHHVHYHKEGDPLTNGDAQSVAQHIRNVEFSEAKAKGLDTSDMERPRGFGYNQPRGLGVRTNSEDFVAGDED